MQLYKKNYTFVSLSLLEKMSLSYHKQMSILIYFSLLYIFTWNNFMNEPVYSFSFTMKGDVQCMARPETNIFNYFYWHLYSKFVEHVIQKVDRIPYDKIIVIIGNPWVVCSLANDYIHPRSVALKVFQKCYIDVTSKIVYGLALNQLFQETCHLLFHSFFDGECRIMIVINYLADELGRKERFYHLNEGQIDSVRFYGLQGSLSCLNYVRRCILNFSLLVLSSIIQFQTIVLGETVVQWWYATSLSCLLSWIRVIKILNLCSWLLYNQAEINNV